MSNFFQKRKKEYEEMLLISKKKIEEYPLESSLMERWRLLQDYLDSLSVSIAYYRFLDFHKQPISGNLLNYIRAYFFKMIEVGETIFSKSMNLTFSEIDEILEPLKDISIEERVLFYQKSSYIIEFITFFSKMDVKMRFVLGDLIGRLVVIMKNSFPYKDLYPALSLTHSEHENFRILLSLLRLNLSKVAKMFRENYELRDKSEQDMVKALSFIKSLKKISDLVNDTQEADNLKKEYRVWENKYIADLNAKKKGGSSS